MTLNENKDAIQKEAFKALEANNFNGFYIMPTGTGKGKVLCDVLLRLNPKRVLYVCDNKELRDRDFPNELRKWGCSRFIEIIDFKCYAGAYKMEGENYDLILADEADYGLTPMYSKVFFNNSFRHKVLASATLSNEKRGKAQMIVPIVYEKTIKEIKEEKVVNKEQIYFVNFDLTPSENKKYLSFNDQYKRLLNEKPINQKRLENLTHVRKHFLSSLLSSRNTCIKLVRELYDQSPNNKIIVFCGSNEQADKVCRYSFHTGNSKLNHLKIFNEGVIRVLSVCGKIDRGLNLVGVNNTVFEAPSKSETKLLQRTGRGRRLDVDDILKIYFLIPYYNARFGGRKPTIVQSWVLESAKNLELHKAKIYKLKN